jgi:hypothetical protein
LKFDVCYFFLWESIIVVAGPRRASKEFSQTRFASFTMPLKIKLFIIDDDDWVSDFLYPFIISKDQSSVGL